MSSAPEIHVRLATPDDADWCVHTATLDSRSFAQQLPGLNEVIVAEINGRLVGMLHLNYLWPGHDSGVPYISLLNVLREHQRKGVGKAMLAFAEGHLRQRGHGVLMSSCVINEDEPQEWHRHMAFAECGRLSGIPFDDGLGEVFLYKRLD